MITSNWFIAICKQSKTAVSCRVMTRSVNGAAGTCRKWDCDPGNDRLVCLYHRHLQHDIMISPPGSRSVQHRHLQASPCSWRPATEGQPLQTADCRADSGAHQPPRHRSVQTTWSSHFYSWSQDAYTTF